MPTHWTAHHTMHTHWMTQSLFCCLFLLGLEIGPADIQLILPPTAFSILPLFSCAIWTTSWWGIGWGACPSTAGNSAENSAIQVFSPPEETPDITISEGWKYLAPSERFTFPDLDLLQEIKILVKCKIPDESVCSCSKTWSSVNDTYCLNCC